MKNVGLENIQEAQEFNKLQPGGYICVINKVVDKSDKEYLEVYYDIAVGENKNHFFNLYSQFGNWPNSGIMRRSYKQTALSFFKSFTTAVEKSNAGYKFDYQEQKLVKKVFGAVLAEEEYENQKGEIKTRIYVAQVRSVDSIKNGDFKVPELKKYTSSPKAASSFDDMPDIFTPVGDNDDLPF